MFSLANQILALIYTQKNSNNEKTNNRGQSKITFYSVMNYKFSFMNKKKTHFMPDIISKN